MCFFFNDTATTEIYTLSLHDALPISTSSAASRASAAERATTTATISPANATRSDGIGEWVGVTWSGVIGQALMQRSEEHTSELQARQYLVCRLLLAKKHNMPTLVPEV